jgi:hypothetical protein
MSVASVMSVSAALVSAGLSMPLAAQVAIDHVTGAPFTAIRTHTRNTDGKIVDETTFVARASNGSTYAAESLKGNVFRITIEDVPNAREITLIPQPPSYTYLQMPAVGGKIRTLTLAQSLDYLVKANQSFIDRPDRDKPNGRKYHDISLGEKQDGGLILFGVRSEITSETGQKQTIESWRSDFGITTSSRLDDPEKKLTEITMVSNLVRTEPDPKLFEIPPDYLPHPDPLLDAKTILIDNQTGSREVYDGAAGVLKGWDRVKLVDVRADADLIARFVNTTEDEGKLAPTSPIEMRVYGKESKEPLFVSNLVPSRYNPDLPAKPSQSLKSYATVCALAC